MAFFRRVTGRVKSGIYLCRINEECRGLRVPVTCRLLPRVKVLSQRQNRLRLGGRSLRLTQAEEILEIPNRKSKLYAQKARCYKVLKIENEKILRNKPDCKCSQLPLIYSHIFHEPLNMTFVA